MTSVPIVHKKKRIRMACSVELMSGLCVQGYTREISATEVFIESQGFSQSGRAPPHPGDPAILGLHYHWHGEPKELRIKCHVMQVISSGLELNVAYSELTRAEQVIIGGILLRGSGALP